MVKLITIISFSIILLYKLLNIILEFIGKNDTVINDSKKARLIVAVIFGLAMAMLYIKCFLTVSFFRYYILMVYLTITGYVDHYSKSVYNFLSYVFLGIGLIFFTFSVFNGESVFKYLLIIAGSFSIAGTISALKLLGWGDVETFVIASIYIGDFVAVKNIFLAFSLAGIGAIFKILTGRAKFRDRGTLCPYIAISTYLIAIFIL